jgi:hypothetical protein
MEPPPVRLAVDAVREGAPASFFYLRKYIYLRFANGYFTSYPSSFREEKTTVSVDHSCTPGREVNV